jgi:hypothetical protein
MIHLFGLINTDYYSQTRQMFRSIINDQLVIQLLGTLSLLLSKCEGISQSLLYHLQLYPIGYRRKNIIL